MKRETERMLAAVQDLTIRMNYRKAKLRSDGSSAPCGMCKYAGCCADPGYHHFIRINNYRRKAKKVQERIVSAGRAKG